VHFAAGQQCLLVKEGNKGWTLLLTGNMRSVLHQMCADFYIFDNQEVDNIYLVG